MEAFMVNFRSDGRGAGGCIIAEDIKELRAKHPNVLVLDAFACGGLTLSYIAGEEKSDHRALLEMFLGMAYFANSKTTGPDCYQTSWHREQEAWGARIHTIIDQEGGRGTMVPG
ncbi:MAG: hypothetical protein UW32_C0001G0540 [Candidatus Wolfebacteria bacterium GW2011_GWE2_44_13]|uniref:Uncharacterized protein n=1 Tax=Candidatus Wolfebacteria bacterium GW2011_GWE2_44_13 TaxID=1619017 RepID=A0A0G1HBP8_9BACT|nr:MAG: hypothetical protein UW32_C0001G0540 [Candidatus Wolfebacteria bacterium GW2011_GWE2_44_13]